VSSLHGSAARHGDQPYSPVSPTFRVHASTFSKDGNGTLASIYVL
jgi:hypothetical protein